MTLSIQKSASIKLERAARREALAALLADGRWHRMDELRQVGGWRCVIPPHVRFDSFISPEPNSGCWLWTGGCDEDGYGVFRISAVPSLQARAHKYNFERIVGPVPEGLELDHLCRVRCCVNPSHLEPVTGRVNTLRGHTLPAANAAKRFCLRGHPLYGPNLFIRPGGARGCRVCRHNVTPKKTSRRARSRLQLEKWVREECAR